MRDSAALQLLLLAGLLAGLLVLSTGMGFIRIPAADVLRVVAGRLTGDPEWVRGMNEIFPVVVLDVRLPRILTAALVGGGSCSTRWPTPTRSGSRRARPSARRSRSC